MADPIRNFFKSTLVGTYSNSATSLTIATGDGALLPDPSTDGAFNLTIFEGVQVTNSTSFEIVRVTAISGDVLTVTRGAENTTPLTISSSTHSILMSATKKTFDDINTAIENVDLTTLTSVEELTFDSTGDEEFGLPAGTTAQRPASPSAGYMRWNSTDSRIEFYNGTRWAGLSEIGLQQETMQVAQLSVTANDAVAEIPLEVEYLVIAGGGSGASFFAGGGGAGGYRTATGLQLEPSTNYTVTIGAGGASISSSTRGNSGSNSVFSTITSAGGGGAGSLSENASDGGSGGGGSGGTSTGSSTTAGGSGNTPATTPPQGNDGGTGFDYRAGGAGGGGGGGAGSAGGDANATGENGGIGGSGVSSSITGTSVGRGGGGGGGLGDTASGIAGTASDGGGAGIKTGSGSSATATSGTANTGGGGGGCGASGTSGAGGSGVVILRYPSVYSITVGAGLTGSESTDGSDKYAVITAGTGNVSWSEV